MVDISEPLAHFGLPDGHLALDEEVLHRAEAVTLAAQGGHLMLGVAHTRTIVAQTLHVPIVIRLLFIVAHVTSLVDVDIGVAACSVRVVVHILNSGTRLLRVAKVARCLAKLALPPRLRGFIFVRIAAVIITDVRVAARAIGIVDAGLPDDLENF